MKCAVVPKESADSTIRILLSRNAINKRYKITKQGSMVVIPLLSYDYMPFEVVECNPRERTSMISPRTIILRKLRNLGVKDDEIPERWIRYGKALIIGIQGDHEDIIAKEFIDTLGVESVYKPVGRIQGVFRTPNVRLISGRGGLAIHRENGIRYIFDPEKIMFSPGNVNERVLASKLKLKGMRVLDMYCGIGYFTLPISKYSGASKVVAVDINPLAIEYLNQAKKINKVDDKVVAINADSSKFDSGENFDLIVMGNFDSPVLLNRAIGNLLPHGTIILHHLVSTDQLNNIPTIIGHIAEREGNEVKIVSSHIVKSYSPNIWHCSTILSVI